MLLFGFIYMLVPDDKWYGINRMKDIVHDEVAREKVEEEVQETNEIIIKTQKYLEMKYLKIFSI